MWSQASETSCAFKWKIVSYPFIVYCFNSVISQLEALLKRPKFPNKCEHWRNRKVSDNVYGDIYGGQGWKDFLTFKGKDFLKSPRSMAFYLV